MFVFVSSAVLLLITNSVWAQTPGGIFGNTLAPLILPEGEFGTQNDFTSQVEREYILVFEEGNGELDNIINELFNKLGATGDELEQVTAPGCTRGQQQPCPSNIRIGDFRSVIVETSDPDSVNRLRQLKRLKYVEKAGVVTKSQISCTTQNVGTGTSGSLWGLDHLDIESGETLNRNGQFEHDSNGGNGVNAYILDTGIRISHNDFGGRAEWGATFCTGCSNADGDGHGTHVAGTVGGSTHGVAKQVTLVAVKVLDDNGSGSSAGVIQGINWVVAQAAGRTRGTSVINMSLGGGASQSLDDAVNAAVGTGVPVVVSAGNSNANACNFSPARATQAITVGSITARQSRSSFSNFGTCLDIFAPGQSVLSTWYTSNTATATLSGTSMSSPHVAGSIAVFLSQNDCATPTHARTWLIAQSVSGVIGRGTGSPDRMAQVDCDNNDPSITCDGGPPTDPCSPNPCQNGGTCSDDGDGTFTCTCAPGYTGTTCQTPISNACSSSPCINGDCVPTNSGGYRCRCDNGWTGTNCDTPIDQAGPCESAPCQNGGTCRTRRRRYQCICAPGFRGRNCQTPVAAIACESAPCQNGGTCVQTRRGRSYFCRCPVNFRGRNCQTGTGGGDGGGDFDINRRCVLLVCRSQSPLCNSCRRRGRSACQRRRVEDFCDGSPSVCEDLCN